MSESYYQRHKDIIKARSKLWKKNNPNKVLLSQKKYREGNKHKIASYEKIRHQRPEVKEKLRKNALTHYYNHKDSQIKRMRNWRKNNQDWFVKWRKDNAKHKSEYQVEYQNRTPQNKMIHRLRSRLQSAFRLYTKEGKRTTSIKYGIDYMKIIEYLKPFPDDISKYHIDHIKPLCSFGLTNAEEIKKAFAPENHQWLLAEENLSKNKYY